MSVGSPIAAQWRRLDGIREILRVVSLACAYFGGLLISLTCLTVFVSIMLRATTGDSLFGDIELVEITTAVGASLFLPYAQMTGAHVRVEVFTYFAGPRFSALMAWAGALIMAVIFAVLVWRTVAGAETEHRYHETFVMLRWPLWMAIAALVPGMALAAINALLRVDAYVADRNNRGGL